MHNTFSRGIRWKSSILGVYIAFYNILIDIKLTQKPLDSMTKLFLNKSVSNDIDRRVAASCPVFDERVQFLFHSNI